VVVRRGTTILSVPSPAGGGVLVAAAQILDALPEETLAAPGLARGQAIVEAVRLARAKSASRKALDDVTDGPLVTEWLTREWARREAARIRGGHAIPAKELDGTARLATGDRGTTQISVVDAQGNAVSLTQSLGRYFGAAWAPPSLGFLLNAFVEPLDATDPASPAFLKPGGALPVPVAPMILVRNDKVALVAGSAGSSRIPSILLAFVAGLVDGRGRPAEVGSEPRILWEDDTAGPRVMIEVAPPVGPADAAALTAMGYGTVYALTEPDRNLSAFGGINAVAWDAASSSWLGLIDVRRPGTAAAPTRLAMPAR
jgi:gamma-glutamyltranspeptidase/glutathione hydrolase